MPAPDFATLYNFEDQMEDAWQSVLLNALADQSVDADVYVTRDIRSKTTPSVEVEFIVGSAGTQRHGVVKAGQPYREVPNSFNGSLIVRVVSTRALPVNTAQHGKIRGAVRYTLTAAANVIKANTNMPYLQILEMLPAASTPRMIDEKEQDITEFTYAMQFAIDNSAWPS